MLQTGRNSSHLQAWRRTSKESKDFRRIERSKKLEPLPQEVRRPSKGSASGGGLVSLRAAVLHSSGDAAADRDARFGTYGTVSGLGGALRRSAERVEEGHLPRRTSPCLLGTLPRYSSPITRRASTATATDAPHAGAHQHAGEGAGAHLAEELQQEEQGATAARHRLSLLHHRPLQRPSGRPRPSVLLPLFVLTRIF